MRPGAGTLGGAGQASERFAWKLAEAAEPLNDGICSSDSGYISGYSLDVDRFGF